jgi:membrane protease YdiL (CAAX protease family)
MVGDAHRRSASPGVVGKLSPLPDLSAFPTTSYRWSMFLMGGVTSGVVEEAAYRGYMQTGLERRDPDNAILITSLVFVLSHITHGLGAVLLLGPGIFSASVFYGLLARRTGTIVPGMVIHVAGDLAYTFLVYCGRTGACCLWADEPRLIDTGRKADRWIP